MGKANMEVWDRNGRADVWKRDRNREGTHTEQRNGDRERDKGGVEDEEIMTARAGEMSSQLPRLLPLPVLLTTDGG